MKTFRGFAPSGRREASSGEPGDDGALRERTRPFSVRIDCGVIAQNGADVVKTPFFVCHGDQPPVAVSQGKLPAAIALAASSVDRDGGRCAATTQATAITATIKSASHFIPVSRA